MSSTPVHADAGSFTPLGTYRAVPFDNVLGVLSSNGIFIDRRNGTPMEMDAYSAYLALKAVDRGDKNNRRLRAEIVRGIEAQRISSGGFWKHGAWVPDIHETHLRFTSYAIRLLIEAHVDGLYDDVDTLVSILREHLAYSEDLPIGLWFLHDTLELPEFADRALEKPSANAVWGSTSGNCLVLNTHIDTLVTLVDALKRLPLDPATRSELEASARSGMRALDAVINSKKKWWFPLFSVVDRSVRAFMLKNQGHRSKLVNIIKWRIIIGGYYNVRKKLKIKSPNYVFDDGYLERDIGLIGYYYDYHIHNLHDIVRIVAACDGTGLMDERLRAQLLSIADRAIEYACRGPYASYMVASMRENGRAMILAEAILARKGLSPNISASPSSNAMMQQIVAGLPPSAAFLGYDPFIRAR